MEEENKTEVGVHPRQTISMTYRHLMGRTTFIPHNMKRRTRPRCHTGHTMTRTSSLFPHNVRAYPCVRWV